MKTKNFKEDKVPQFSTIQVLTNDLNREERERLGTLVAAYRKVKN